MLRSVLNEKQCKGTKNDKLFKINPAEKERKMKALINIKLNDFFLFPIYRYISWLVLNNTHAILYVRKINILEKINKIGILQRKP